MLIPRLGKIKTGKYDNRPISLEHFIFPDASKIESQNNQTIHAKLIELYGETPKTLDIKLPSDDINVFMPRFYKRYVRNNHRICMSRIHIDTDGKEHPSGTASFSHPYTKQESKIECNPFQCEHKNQCSKVSDLYFFLPKIPGFGAWQITTKSFNAMQSIFTSTNLVKTLTGRISLLPLELTMLKEKVSRKEGDRYIDQTINRINIDLGGSTVDELINEAIKLKTLASDVQIQADEETPDNEKITLQTRQAIGKAIKQKNITNEQGLEIMKENYNVTSSDKLTESQGKELIEKILELQPAIGQ